MELGRCPLCQRPYSAGEVAGFGILRARPEQKGGPLVEFACPECGRRILLVPHGQGRYAPPGEPPPPEVPEADRRPPWLVGRKTQRRAAPPPPSEPVPPPPPGHRGAAGGVDAPPRTDPPPGTARGPVPEPQLDVFEALALLGLDPTADRAAIDRAYRERSLACHPDKVAHLDPDFQALAQRKFVRLKAAYDLLTS